MTSQAATIIILSLTGISLIISSVIWLVRYLEPTGLEPTKDIEPVKVKPHLMIGFCDDDDDPDNDDVVKANSVLEFDPINLGTLPLPSNVYNHNNAFNPPPLEDTPENRERIARQIVDGMMEAEDYYYPEIDDHLTSEISYPSESVLTQKQIEDRDIQEYIRTNGLAAIVNGKRITLKEFTDKNKWYFDDKTNEYKPKEEKQNNYNLKRKLDL